MQKDFTPDLKVKIQDLESSLELYIKDLEAEYKSIFNDKNLAFSVEFEREGTDHFQPSYSSSIYLGIADELTLVNLHKTPIWKCERILFGLSVSKPVPFSKVVGELIEESLEEIKEEVRENCEEMLSEEY